MRVEVRCCCQPQKLRGHIDVPPGAAVPGRPYRWPLLFYDGHVAWVELTFAMFSPGPGSRPYIALKSEDVPIETLRRIKGFEPYA